MLISETITNRQQANDLCIDADSNGFEKVYLFADGSAICFDNRGTIVDRFTYEVDPEIAAEDRAEEAEALHNEDSDYWR